jgi:hypothetical protein
MSTTFLASDVSSRSLTLAEIEDSVLRLSQQTLPLRLPFPCFENKYITVWAESVTRGHPERAASSGIRMRLARSGGKLSLVLLFRSISSGKATCLALIDLVAVGSLL